MFIRQVKKQRSKDAKIFYQYTLAQTSRIEGKVKQFSVLYLGSDPLLADKENRAMVLAILKSKIFKQPELFPNSVPEQIEALALSYFQKYQQKYEAQDMTPPTSIPPDARTAEYENIDIKGLEVRDSKSFGAEHLCKQIVDKLQLRRCLKSLGMSDHEVGRAVISVLGRAIFAASEYKTAQHLNENSALLECLGYRKPITHKQLYAIADKLYSHQSEIDNFLNKRIDDLFDLEDKLVIFDISNTYFETNKSQSALADYGRSKEKRHDCPIIVFTGVVNAQGFMRHSRTYQGKTADSSTLEDMLNDLEEHSKEQVRKTVVIDAGIATEDNLALLRHRGYKYVCVSRQRIKDYPADEIQQAISVKSSKDKYDIDLKVFKPEGAVDTWMYVQSEHKRKKEASMRDKLTQRYEQHLQTIKAGIAKKGGTKRYAKVWERIGRAREKHKIVSGQFDIKVTQQEGIATQITWTKKPSKIKDDKAKGIYFLRTNYENPSEKELWDIYNTIREVEATFRCLKTDLNIRPIHHQLDSRIQSHIYLAILAYQVVNTIRYMLKQKGIHQDWNNIRRVLSNHNLQTLVLPTDKKDIHLRAPTVPSTAVKQIFDATRCNPLQDAIKKYVVYH